MLAVRQASINPARALGLPFAGLVPGATADLVVLDPDLAVRVCCSTDHGSSSPNPWVSAQSSAGDPSGRDRVPPFRLSAVDPLRRSSRASRR